MPSFAAKYALAMGALLLGLGARPAQAKPLPPTTLYLHTEGLDINVSYQAGQGCVPGFQRCGVSDARTNTSWLPDVRKPRLTIPPMEYSRFGGSKAMVQAALLAQVREFFAGINLKIVNKRPSPDTRYSMVVIGGSPSDIGLDSSIAGLAPLDCDDANPWDITFVFSESLRSLDSIARVTVQEAAHSYGIEHVRAPEYVMNPEPIGGALGLGRSCLPMDPSPGLSNPDGIKCLHACPDPSYQNSFAELQALFGKGPLLRSSAPPQVQIRYPEQGNHFFESPTDLRLDLEVVNPQDLTHVELSVNASPAVKNSMYPYAYRLHALGDGSYTAKITAYDIYGQQTEHEVEFSVGPLERKAAKPPSVRADQISLRVDRLTGSPVRCESDRVCYGGTTCQDGLCLRPLPPSGCHLGGLGPGLWCAPLGLLLLGRRKRRSGAILNSPQIRP